MVWPCPSLDADPKTEQIAARVNRIAITYQSVERLEVLFRGPESETQADSPAEDKQRRSFRLALELLINDELLYQEAVARGIKVEKEKVHQVIRKVKETIPGAEFSRLVVAHWAVKGEIVKAIERNLIIQRLLKEEVLDKVNVSEKDLIRFYDTNQELFRTSPEVRLQQILFLDASKLSTELMLSKAREVATQARAGENFADLLRAHSQGPARDRGGDLGWRSVQHLPLELQKRVQEATEGSVVGPVSVPGGLVVAKVLAKRPSRVLPFEEVRDHLESKLRGDELKRLRGKFIQVLMSRANIEVFLP